MQSPTILTLRGIRKTYPGVVALEDVDFDLRKGEVHILLGENGAGKSTLVKILSGACRRTSGRIYLDEAETDIKSPKHAQDLGIRVIYQELNLVPYLSVADNLFLGREPSLLPGILDQSAINESAQRLLAALGLDIDPRTAVGTLGIAEQQMVEIAKALSSDARIIMMDEPTSALTESEIRQLFATIRTLKQKGVSIIYISHRLEETFEIGDRVSVLRDGKLIATHPISDVTQSELIRLMVDRELKEQFPKQKARLGEEVLRVEGLTRNGAFSDVSFSLHRGEVLGIAGLMGSGRTQLARVLFGVDRADRGVILVRGERHEIDSVRTAIKLKMGFVTEDRKTEGLILNLSVKDNICLPSLARFSTLGVMRASKEQQAALGYVKQLAIKTPGLRQRVVLLSGGNQQKVVLGKWLCSNAEILILDEPTRGIDVGAKVEIYEWINRLTFEGAAILMISSELPEILGMSDRILVMRHGTIAGEFRASEATQERILEAALGSYAQP
ncbi:MAG: sugar ABC transporter ATP-binding protein [Acidobacteria bacterium]|nr:MAG: sugar ABC transporter ATP-binding protein [Acidobacteriota bacterium]